MWDAYWELVLQIAAGGCCLSWATVVGLYLYDRVTN